MIKISLRDRKGSLIENKGDAMKSRVFGDVEMKDVFVSHSSKDKTDLIEPLVSELESEGLSCWYDLREILPGDSLVGKINNGLANCKVILLCISENFLNGTWTIEELESSIGLGLVSEKVVRVVPLMLCDPKLAIEKYPIPFANTFYIEWTKCEDVAQEIKRVVANIDNTDNAYWLKEAELSYSKKDYVKSAIYSWKASEYQDSYSSNVLYLASLIQLGKKKGVYSHILKKKYEWDCMDKSRVSVECLDFVQQFLSEAKNHPKDIGDNAGLTSAIISIFLEENNVNNSYKYLINLYGVEAFSFHRDDIVKYIMFLGKAESFCWAKNEVFQAKENKVVESLLLSLYVFGCVYPDKQKEIGFIAEKFLNDRDEEIRGTALVPYYFFVEGSARKVCNMLNDRDSLVRLQAFELLSGSYNKSFDERWESVEGDHRKPDSELSPGMIKKLLLDPDEDVREGVLSEINDGYINISMLTKLALSFDRFKPKLTVEFRESRVKSLAKKSTKDAFQKILKYAFEDSSEFVREEAIQSLIRFKYEFDDDYLRKLFEFETNSYVHSALESLILEKGGDSLGDIYYQIVLNNLDKISFPDEAMNKLISSRNEALIKKAISRCVEEGKAEKLILCVDELIDAGLTMEATPAIEWCIENKEYLEISVLAAGKVNTIPIERIYEFIDYDDLSLASCALRALANRKRDCEAMEGLKKILKKAMQIVIESKKTPEGEKQEIYIKENDAHWAVVNIADGMLEFCSKEAAFSVLHDYFEHAKDAVYVRTFPLRDAWERLRLLGHSPEYLPFVGCEPAKPSKWSSSNEPYYGFSSCKG